MATDKETNDQLVIFMANMLSKSLRNLSPALQTGNHWPRSPIFFLTVTVLFCNCELKRTIWPSAIYILSYVAVIS